MASKSWHSIVQKYTQQANHCKCRDDVPSTLHRPHIITGYRPMHQSIWYYVTSVFQPNNEAGNFWTHFLPFLYFAQRYVRMFLVYGGASYALPFYAHGFGTCYLLFCSSMAHMLSSKSTIGCQCAYAIDFASIYAYGVAMKVPLEFYLCPTEHYCGVSSSAALILFAIYCASALAATFYASEKSWKNAVGISTSLYVIGTWIIYGSCMLRYFISDAGFTTVEPINKDHVSLSVGHHLTLHFGEQLLYLIMGLVFFSTNFPERLAPKTFDIVGNSHQIFHLFIALAMYAQSIMLELVVNEIETKYHDGHFDNEVISLSWFETIGHFVLTTVLTHLVVYFYWLHLRKAQKLKAAYKACSD